MVDEALDAKQSAKLGAQQDVPESAATWEANSLNHFGSYIVFMARLGLKMLETCLATLMHTGIEKSHTQEKPGVLLKWIFGYVQCQRSTADFFAGWIFRCVGNWTCHISIHIPHFCLPLIQSGGFNSTELVRRNLRLCHSLKIGNLPQ